MNILITGGTAFVSRRTAEHFVAEGDRVYVLNRGSAPQSDGVIHIKADRRDAFAALRGLRFDAVLDITAYNAADVDSLLDALDAGRCADFSGGAGYILLSSSAVYPETLPQPFKETAPCGENIHWGTYGTDKIAAERALLRRVPGAYIVRPPYLCGAMNNLYREAFVFDCAERGRKMYFPGDGSLPLQFFDAGDLCRFFGTVLKSRTEHHVFNAGSRQTVSAAEWCVMCYSLLKKTPELVYVDRDSADPRDYFPFRDYAYRLDTARQDAVMPDTIPLEQSLLQSWEWYRDNRELVRRKPYIEYVDRFLA